MLITEKLKAGELILHDLTLLPLLNRFGIELGFQDKTIEQICSENGINIDFFLEITNAFHDKDYVSNDLHSFSLKLIIDYLMKSHNYYRTIKIPRIKELINKLFWESNEEKNRSVLLNFYNEYIKEVIEHLDYEENKIYPYIIDIEKSYKNQSKQKKQKYSALNYQNVHSDINSKLLDLKNIVIKYLPPALNSEIQNELLQEIFMFEKDLKDHSKIENTVLIPRVKAIEKLIL